MHAAQIRQKKATRQYKIVLSLLEAIGSLTELLNRETEALEKFQIYELIRLICKKDELSENYDSRVKAFHTLNLQIGEIDPNLLKQLQDKTRNLFQASERNKMAIQIVQIVNQEIIQWLPQTLKNCHDNSKNGKSRLRQDQKRHLSVVHKNI